MTSGAWPYLAGQCPACLYFQAASQPVVDDAGYEIRGFCRHPRMAMELFEPQTLKLSDSETCPLFIRSARANPAPSDEHDRRAGYDGRDRADGP